MTRRLNVSRTESLSVIYWQKCSVDGILEGVRKRTFYVRSTMQVKKVELTEDGPKQLKVFFKERKIIVSEEATQKCSGQFGVWCGCTTNTVSVSANISVLPIWEMS